MAEEKEKLIPANENLWYTLATIAGEVTHPGDPFTKKNSDYWNGFMRSRLSEDEYTNLKDRDGKQINLPELTNEEIEHVYSVLNKYWELKKRDFAHCDITDPNEPINFARTEFSKDTSFLEFVSVGNVKFNNATFKKLADFRGTKFTHSADFRAATFTEGAKFNEAEFLGPTFTTGTSFPRPTDSKGGADLSDATFTGGADFDTATFNGVCLVQMTRHSWRGLNLRTRNSRGMLILNREH